MKPYPPGALADLLQHRTRERDAFEQEALRWRRELTEAQAWIRAFFVRITLRTVLMRMRDEGQDGFHGAGPDGRFEGAALFVTTGLPQVTAPELDQLMKLAGITPDPIIPNGSCKDCCHKGPYGGSRGWGMPCAGCAAPKLTRFEGTPRSPVTPSGQCQCEVCKRNDEPWTQ